MKVSRQPLANARGGRRMSAITRAHERRELVQTAAAPSTEAMRRYSPHHPAVEPVEELSEMGFSVVVASRENPGAESLCGRMAGRRHGRCCTLIYRAPISFCRSTRSAARSILRVTGFACE
jgi:hypothetical protein